MSAKRGLGRGFETLIPTGVDEFFDPTAEEDKKESANEIHNQEEFNYNYNYNDMGFNNYGMNLFHRNNH